MGLEKLKVKIQWVGALIMHNELENPAFWPSHEMDPLKQGFKENFYNAWHSSFSNHSK